MEDAVLRRLDVPRRCEARGALLPMPSPMRPPRLPISVDVRSIDMTPGAADKKFCPAGAPPSPAGLFVARDMAEKLEARLVRPLPGALWSRLGSLLLSMMPLQLWECYSV
jgi:hypothetical protein